MHCSPTVCLPCPHVNDSHICAPTTSWVLTQWSDVVCRVGNVESPSTGDDQSAMLSHAVTPLESDCCFIMCFCVYSVLCFIEELKIYWINHNTCIVWSLLSPWYCIKQKKKKNGEKKHINETCWPSAVKNFFNVTIRNLSRNKNVAFFLYKREIYEKPQQWGMWYCVYISEMDLTIYGKYVHLLWIRYVKTF